MNQETLLLFDTPSNNKNQNFTNEKKNNLNTLTFNGEKICCLILYQMTCLSVIAAAAAIFIVFNYNDWGEIFIFIFLIIAVTWGVFFNISVKKVEFIKNECMNQLTLKITKRCGCSKQYSIMLENKNILYQNDIFALNTLENSSEIDLDNSNIKNYPINLVSKYELFGGLERSDNEIQLEIDEFFGQKKYENNIIFMMKLINIIVYIKKIFRR